MDKAFGLLGEYIGEQWGMVTTRQAKSLGIDAVTLYRLKDAGFLDPVRRGVYVATSAAVHRRQAEQAAWLALRPGIWAWDRNPLDPDDGVLSHDTAARLHGFGELVDSEIAFTVPRRRTSRDTDLWFKIDDSLTDEDVTLVDGLPVTTMLRTVYDLLDQHIDGSHIATIIREAVEAGQLRLDTLADRIAPYARRYRVRPLTGTALLEHLLEQIGLTIDDLATRPRPGKRANSADALVAATALSHLGGQLAALGQTDEMLKNLREITAPVLAAGASSHLLDAMRHNTALGEFSKNLSALQSPNFDVLSRALGTFATLQGRSGDELRQQIARSAATGQPRKTLARQDVPRDEPDADDD